MFVNKSMPFYCWILLTNAIIIVFFFKILNLFCFLLLWTSIYISNVIEKTALVYQRTEFWKNSGLWCHAYEIYSLGIHCWEVWYRIVFYGRQVHLYSKKLRANHGLKSIGQNVHGSVSMAVYMWHLRYTHGSVYRLNYFHKPIYDQQYARFDFHELWV